MFCVAAQDCAPLEVCTRRSSIGMSCCYARLDNVTLLPRRLGSERSYMRAWRTGGNIHRRLRRCPKLHSIHHQSTDISRNVLPTGYLLYEYARQLGIYANHPLLVPTHPFATVQQDCKGGDFVALITILIFEQLLLLSSGAIELCKDGVCGVSQAIGRMAGRLQEDDGMSAHT